MKIVLASIVVGLLAFLLWGIYDNSQSESNDNSFPEPIAGAFGVSLGKHFKPEMVKEVLSKEQKEYTVKEGVKLPGTVIQFKPNEPDNNFQQYEIKTTQSGIIYSIEGKYQGDKEMTPKVCKAIVKSLAEEQAARYGKPRGKDSFGQWYSFRQTSDFSKSLKLYAHRCRTGAYSMVYMDDKVRKEN